MPGFFHVSMHPNEAQINVQCKRPKSIHDQVGRYEEQGY